MKKTFVLITVLLMLCVAGLSQAASVTLTWENDCTLSAAERARLSTVLEVGTHDATGNVLWLVLATVDSGGEKWKGDLPDTIPSGASLRFRAKAVLDGNQSLYCDPVPMPAAARGLRLTIQ
jgi:hypothetical protein